MVVHWPDTPAPEPTDDAVVVHVELRRPEAPPIVRAIVIVIALAILGVIVWQFFFIRDKHEAFEERREEARERIERASGLPGSHPTR